MDHDRMCTLLLWLVCMYLFTTRASLQLEVELGQLGQLEQLGCSTMSVHCQSRSWIRFWVCRIRLRHLNLCIWFFLVHPCSRFFCIRRCLNRSIFRQHSSYKRLFLWPICDQELEELGPLLATKLGGLCLNKSWIHFLFYSIRDVHQSLGI